MSQLAYDYEQCDQTVPERIEELEAELRHRVDALKRAQANGQDIRSDEFRKLNPRDRKEMVKQRKNWVSTLEALLQGVTAPGITHDVLDQIEEETAGIDDEVNALDEAIGNEPGTFQPAPQEPSPPQSNMRAHLIQQVGQEMNTLQHKLQTGSNRNATAVEFQKDMVQQLKVLHCALRDETMDSAQDEAACVAQMEAEFYDILHKVRAVEQEEAAAMYNNSGGRLVGHLPLGQGGEAPPGGVIDGEIKKKKKKKNKKDKDKNPDPAPPVPTTGGSSSSTGRFSLDLSATKPATSTGLAAQLAQLQQQQQEQKQQFAHHAETRGGIPLAQEEAVESEPKKKKKKKKQAEQKLTASDSGDMEETEVPLAPRSSNPNGGKRSDNASSSSVANHKKSLTHTTALPQQPGGAALSTSGSAGATKRVPHDEPLSESDGGEPEDGAGPVPKSRSGGRGHVRPQDDDLEDEFRRRARELMQKVNTIQQKHDQKQSALHSGNEDPTPDEAEDDDKVSSGEDIEDEVDLNYSSAARNRRLSTASSTTSTERDDHHLQEDISRATDDEDEEAVLLRAEQEEAAKRKDAIAKRKAEREAARRRLEEEEKEEEEAARREEEAARKKAQEEEEKRVLARKKAAEREEEEARRKKRIEEEEAAALKREKELQEEKEREEEEARRKEEEEELEKKKKEEEKRRQKQREEEEALEAQRKKEEEEKKAKQEAEKRRQEEEEEEARKRVLEEKEAQRKREEEEEAARKRREEEEQEKRRKKEKEEQETKEKERREREEEETRRTTKEQKEKEAKRKAEEEEAARKQAREAEARKKVEEEETARKKADEDEAARKKLQDDEAARKKAEQEEARKKADEEEAAKKKEEEAARTKAEQEVARKKAQETEDDRAVKQRAEEEEEAARRTQKAKEEEEARLEAARIAKKKVEEEEEARVQTQKRAEEERKRAQEENEKTEEREKRKPVTKDEENVSRKMEESAERVKREERRRSCDQQGEGQQRTYAIREDSSAVQPTNPVAEPEETTDVSRQLSSPPSATEDKRKEQQGVNNKGEHNTNTENHRRNAHDDNDHPLPQAASTTGVVPDTTNAVPELLSGISSILKQLQNLQQQQPVTGGMAAPTTGTTPGGYGYPPTVMLAPVDTHTLFSLFHRQATLPQHSSSQFTIPTTPPHHHLAQGGMEVTPNQMSSIMDSTSGRVMDPRGVGMMGRAPSPSMGIAGNSSQQPTTATEYYLQQYANMMKNNHEKERQLLVQQWLGMQSGFTTPQGGSSANNNNNATATANVPQHSTNTTNGTTTKVGVASLPPIDSSSIAKSATGIVSPVQRQQVGGSSMGTPGTSSVLSPHQSAEAVTLSDIPPSMQVPGATSTSTPHPSEMVPPLATQTHQKYNINNNISVIGMMSENEIGPEHIKVQLSASSSGGTSHVPSNTSTQPTTVATKPHSQRSAVNEGEKSKDCGTRHGVGVGSSVNSSVGVTTTTTTTTTSASGTLLPDVCCNNSVDNNCTTISNVSTPNMSSSHSHQSARENHLLEKEAKLQEREQSIEQRELQMQELIKLWEHSSQGSSGIGFLKMLKQSTQSSQSVDTNMNTNMTATSLNSASTTTMPPKHHHSQQQTQHHQLKDHHDHHHHTDSTLIKQLVNELDCGNNEAGSAANNVLLHTHHSNVMSHHNEMASRRSGSRPSSAGSNTTSGNKGKHTRNHSKIGNKGHKYAPSASFTSTEGYGVSAAAQQALLARSLPPSAAQQLRLTQSRSKSKKSPYEHIDGPFGVYLKKMQRVQANELMSNVTQQLYHAHHNLITHKDSEYVQKLLGERDMHRKVAIAEKLGQELSKGAAPGTSALLRHEVDESPNGGTDRVLHNMGMIPISATNSPYDTGGPISNYKHFEISNTSNY